MKKVNSQFLTVLPPVQTSKNHTNQHSEYCQHICTALILTHSSTSRINNTFTNFSNYVTQIPETVYGS